MMRCNVLGKLIQELVVSIDSTTRQLGATRLEQACQAAASKAHADSDGGGGRSVSAAGRAAIEPGRSAAQQ